MKKNPLKKDDTVSESPGKNTNVYISVRKAV